MAACHALRPFPVPVGSVLVGVTAEAGPLIRAGSWIAAVWSLSYSVFSPDPRVLPLPLERCAFISSATASRTAAWTAFFISSGIASLPVAMLSGTRGYRIWVTLRKATHLCGAQHQVPGLIHTNSEEGRFRLEVPSGRKHAHQLMSTLNFHRHIRLHLKHVPGMLSIRHGKTHSPTL